MATTLLLASKSPRRKELLTQIGLPVRIVSIDVDEKDYTACDSSRIAEQLSRKKADAYPIEKIGADDILITADTLVVLDDEVMGKPQNRKEAIEMLQRLSGRQHTVYTGVTLTTRERQISFTEATRVQFKPLRREVIEYYVDNYKPLDKAGAYGIQEWIGMVGIERIEGCYYNVMGLPISHLFDAIRQIM